MTRARPSLLFADSLTRFVGRRGSKEVLRGNKRSELVRRKAHDTSWRTLSGSRTVTRRLARHIAAAWILWDTTGGIPTPQGSYLTKWGCEWDVRSKLNAAYTKAKSQEGTTEK